MIERGENAVQLKSERAQSPRELHVKMRFGGPCSRMHNTHIHLSVFLSAIASTSARDRDPRRDLGSRRAKDGKKKV